MVTALLSWAPPTSAQDVIGPALVDCTVSPATLDATGGPATGTWTLQATDDLSGVETAAILFVHPVFATLLSADVDATHLIAGDALDGTWSTTFEVPEFSPSGSWGVFLFSLTDVAGNTTSVPPASLPASCGFDVASLPDTAPPTLAALSASTGAVDVTLGPAAITLTTVLEDDRSGVDHAAITFESPSGAENVVVDVESGHLVAGDALSGTYTVGFEIPQLAENGTWNVASARIVDAYGYVTQLDGASLGIPNPPTIDVTSTPDSTPPELVWLSATPEIVYLGASPPSVTLRARIRDDVTGLGVNGILLESPVEGVIEAVSFDESNRVSGTAFDGIYQATVVFDVDAPTGAWVLSISVADPAGNDVQYSGGQIPGPAQIQLVAGDPPPPVVPVTGALGAGLIALLIVASGTRRSAGDRSTAR